jgi:single-strand DNA-binding protein
MSSLNSAELIGNVGADPEIRTTQGGKKVANFRIATSERWKQDGEQKERTEWHSIVVWDKLADIAEKFISKGSKVYVAGKIQTRKWKDQAGADRYSTEIVLNGFAAQLILLSPKGEGGSRGNGGGTQQSGGSDNYGGGYADDDAPF